MALQDAEAYIESVLVVAAHASRGFFVEAILYARVGSLSMKECARALVTLYRFTAREGCLMRHEI